MIGLIDVDSKLPNIALMKISSYYKACGEIVEFAKADLSKYEKVYASCIFSRNRKQCEKLLKIRPDIEIGGTGWDIEKKLLAYIDQMPPDYSLYSYPDAIEFSTRGCIRNCNFCVVPKKEGKLCQYKPLSQIIRSDSKNLMLLDNNFTADPLMIDKCKECFEFWG